GLPPIPGSYFQPQLIAPLSASAYAISRGGESGIMNAPLGFAASGSNLMLMGIQSLPDNRVSLTLNIPAGQGCTVLFSAKPSGGEWSAIASYAPVRVTRTLQLIAPAPATSGFYRLRSP
ncbi:MAG TPA: hypothetical protein VJ063_17595, partial [Verrucomicrobiae bacterium]|nr:hypothetical protein [Verrucomicrobiae bacterium]